MIPREIPVYCTFLSIPRLPSHDATAIICLPHTRIASRVVYQVTHGLLARAEHVDGLLVGIHVHRVVFVVEIVSQARDGLVRPLVEL